MAFESGGQLALIDNRYKLFYEVDQAEVGTLDPGWADRCALYDLETDPGEEQDLRPSLPHVVRRLAGELEAWRDSCKASRAGADYAGR